MIDIFDILFFIALLLSLGCVYVSYRLYKEMPLKRLWWLIGSFIFLTLNRVVTCLKGFDIVVVDNDVSSAIGVVTISLLLVGLIALLKAIQKYKRTNGK